MIDKELEDKEDLAVQIDAMEEDLASIEAENRELRRDNEQLKDLVEELEDRVTVLTNALEQIHDLTDI